MPTMFTQKSAPVELRELTHLQAQACIAGTAGVLMAKSTHVTAGVGAPRCVNVRVNATTDTMKNNETETNMDLNTDTAI